jgi:hypothetical protein
VCGGGGGLYPGSLKGTTGMQWREFKYSPSAIHAIRFIGSTSTSGTAQLSTFLASPSFQVQNAPSTKNVGRTHRAYNLPVNARSMSNLETFLLPQSSPIGSLRLAV